MTPTHARTVLLVGGACDGQRVPIVDGAPYLRVPHPCVCRFGRMATEIETTVYQYLNLTTTRGLAVFVPASVADQAWKRLQTEEPVATISQLRAVVQALEAQER